ncbi:MAG: flagellar basal body rod protein FlgB, partial [Oscillospiraceae bacterium]|nr:flagellar basal body rod protein FlgB [Oscillospiraceae bacterium]
MALFDTTAFRILEQGMSVLWQKQQVISQNIANSNTPDYNCKYLE